jgi:DNA-binding protein Fis
MAKARNSCTPIEGRVRFILKNLSQDDRNQLLSELIELSLSANEKELLQCVLDWEETAEINSAPTKKKKLLSRYAVLTGLLSNKCNA